MAITASCGPRRPSPKPNPTARKVRALLPASGISRSPGRSRSTSPPATCRCLDADPLDPERKEMALLPSGAQGLLEPLVPFAGRDRPAFLSDALRLHAAIRLMVSAMWFGKRPVPLPSAQASSRPRLRIARSPFRLSGGVMLHSLSVAPNAASDRLPRARAYRRRRLRHAGDRNDADDSAHPCPASQPITDSQMLNVIAARRHVIPSLSGGRSAFVLFAFPLAQTALKPLDATVAAAHSTWRR